MLKKELILSADVNWIDIDNEKIEIYTTTSKKPIIIENTDNVFVYMMEFGICMHTTSITISDPYHAKIYKKSHLQSGRPDIISYEIEITDI